MPEKNNILPGFIREELSRRPGVPFGEDFPAVQANSVVILRLHAANEAESARHSIWSTCSR
jgi:hypothetical protein